LTAAHCVDELVANPAEIAIGVGKPDVRLAGGHVTSATEVLLHPGWNEATLTDDAALLRLRDPAPQPPLPLMTADVEPSWNRQLGMIAGYGRLGANGAVTPVLYQAGVEILP